MTEKRFELEILSAYDYVIAEFDRDNYYLNDENSAKALECRLNELYDENRQLREEIKDFQDLLANKEEELLKPVLRLIDEKILEIKDCPFIRTDDITTENAQIEVLNELKKELSE